MGSYNVQASDPTLVTYYVCAVGGATAVTAENESGVTISYVTTGNYLLTWANNPGKFINWVGGLHAATPANIAGHTLICDTYNTTAFTLPVWVYNASDAAHDLAALEYLNLQVTFRTGGVGGV
jgi:hypothetical protein